MALGRLRAVRYGLLATVAAGTLHACAEPGTPLHKDYVICADNTTADECGDNVNVVVNENS